MPERKDYAGMAALSICESLLLAMNDNKLLSEREILGVLQDALATHESAAGFDADLADHREVAALISGIIDGGNSVRRR